MSAENLIRTLTERSLTVCTCESLTGGMICAALVDVPGASRVVRGGLITISKLVSSRFSTISMAKLRT